MGDATASPTNHMRTLGQRVVALVALALAPCLTQSARAQVAAPIGNTFEGENGIKIGEGRLHPYFDLELRFDSAAAVSGLNTTSEAITHFRPGFKLEMPPSLIQVAFNGYLDYVFYTGLLHPGDHDFSHFETNVALDVFMNKQGAVEFDLGDRLTRSDRTSDVALGLGVLSFANELRAALPIHPGGGALEVTPSGSWLIERFQPLDSASRESFAVLDYDNYHAGLDARWKFLPKTAVGIETGFDTRRYANPSQNKTPLLFKARAALTGLLTSKLAVVAKVGWGQDFGGSGASSVIGHFELYYLASVTSNFKVGSLRDFSAVPGIYGTYGDDRGYVDARLLLGGRLMLHGFASYDYLTFYSGTNRNDQNITIDVGPEFQFTSWLIAAAGYDLGLRRSNAAVNGQVLNYTRHEVYLRVTFTY